MNILMVLPDKKVGGGQIAALRISEALAKGNNVYVLHAFPEDRDNPSPQIPAGVIPVNSLPGHVETYLPYTLLRCLRFFDRLVSRKGDSLSDGPLMGRVRRVYHLLKKRRFAKLLKDLRISVINSHVLAADLLVADCLCSSDVAWVVTMHGCYEFCLDDPVRYPGFLEQGKRILSRADKIIYLTEKNKKIFEALQDPQLEQKTHKIQTGFSLCGHDKRFRPSILFKDADLVLGLVSRAIPEKGWEEAILATIGARKQTNKNIHLSLLGDGQYADELRHRYDLPFVHFLGFTDEPLGWVSQFDVGLLPSCFSGESLPTAVVEYLACGKPVIATDVGEIRAMVTANGEAAGILLPLVDGGVSVPLLQQAISAYVQEPQLMMDHSSLAKEAARKYSMDECVAEYLRVYQMASE